MSMEHAETPEDEDRGKIPVPGRAGVRSVFAGASSALMVGLAFSSTVGTFAMGGFEVTLDRYARLSQEPTIAWITALIAILFYLACKLPHLMGQEPGDYTSLCREVLYCMANGGIAVWSLAAGPSGVRLAIFSALAVFFVAMTCIEIVIAMRLTSRSWNQSAGGHL